MLWFYVSVAVQWLQVASGIVFLGGLLCFHLMLYPALLRRPAPEAQALLKSLEGPAGRVMGISAQGVLWLGLLRGTWLGPIQSWSALFASAYGHTFLLSLVLFITLGAHSAILGKRMEAALWQGNDWRPDAAVWLRKHALIALALALATVACMVAMRFGL